MYKRPPSYYDLIAFGLGDNSFQDFVDRFQEKYNVPNTEGFAWDPEIQIDFTYEQLLADLGIATLPTYVDIDSPPPYKSTEGFEVGSNKIPRMKHGFTLNEKVIREKMIMMQRFGKASLTEETRRVLLDLLYESVDRLLVGNQNALTYQRMQVVSTGRFSIDANNNPQGIKGLTFEFNIPAANFETLQGLKRWWTHPSHTVANEGTEADPLGDLRRWRRKALKQGTRAVHFEMSQELFDDFLMHTKVLRSIALSQYPTLASDDSALAYGRVMSDAAKQQAIQAIVGCPIVPRDTMAAVDEIHNGSMQKRAIEGFDIHNVALLPDGRLGTIKAVEPIAVADPGTRFAYFDGGRTLIKQLYNSETNTEYIYSECTALVVPTASRYMHIFTVTI